MKSKVDDERRAEASIEQLRDELCRQILIMALADSSFQAKLDSYKATQRPPDRTKQTDAAPADMMAVFKGRVARASQPSVNEDADDDPEPAA